MNNVKIFEIESDVLVQDSKSYNADIIDKLPNLEYFKEHTSNKRKSTKGKHERGQARRRRDAINGEKGDKSRPFRRNGKNILKFYWRI